TTCSARNTAKAVCGRRSMVAINSDIEWAAASGLRDPAVRDQGFAGWRYNGSGRRRDRAKPLVSRFRSSQASAAPSDANFGFGALVSRFRSSQTLAAPSDANFGIKGTLATLCF